MKPNTPMRSRLRLSIQRLTPHAATSGSQKVVQWNIEAPGMENALAYRDGFGNQIYLVTEKDPA